MDTPIIYDLLGIGIGPFNLGLAALTDSIDNMKCLFLDENPSFNWHPGLLLPWARMQVPFHADLVTLADPCSKYSYLSFLKARKRLFRFTIREKYFPLRSEYNDYCQWVARQLKSLRFSSRVKKVRYDTSLKAYAVISGNGKTGQTEVHYAKHIVIGIGSKPYVPSCVINKMHLPFLSHSSGYLFHKKELLKKGDITIIGAGQSAAEIFYDLLEGYPEKVKKLTWLTRSSLFPMDYTKFSCEMTSPEYVAYFFGLDSAIKEEILSRQGNLFKGINASLIDAIYDKLYLLSLTHPDLHSDIRIRPHTELTGVQPFQSKMRLQLFQTQLKQPLSHITAATILATGYENRVPDFLLDVKELLSCDSKGRPAVQRNYAIDKEGKSIFIQNAELHTHGFNAADLGLGVYRNTVIINSILGHNYYDTGDGGIFQTFNSSD